MRFDPKRIPGSTYLCVPKLLLGFRQMGLTHLRRSARDARVAAVKNDVKITGRRVVYPRQWLSEWSRDGNTDWRCSFNLSKIPSKFNAPLWTDRSGYLEEVLGVAILGTVDEAVTSIVSAVEDDKQHPPTTSLDITTM